MTALSTSNAYANDCCSKCTMVGDTMIESAVTNSLYSPQADYVQGNSDKRALWTAQVEFSTSGTGSGLTTGCLSLVLPVVPLPHELPELPLKDLLSTRLPMEL